MTRFSPLATLKHWFSDGVLRRIFKNASLLLSGRAANGLLSLGTLSLMAHGLGAGNFGLVILVQTYVLVITGLATFQSWQALIRYGAIVLKNNDIAGFQNLLKFTAMLDLCGVIVGVLVGYFGAPIVGPYVQWDAEVIEYAQIYSFLILFTVIATPTGLLRLFDRFDLLTAQASITPLLRLIGVAIVAVVFDAPIWAYLLAWFVAGVVGGLSLIVLGWREVAKRGLLQGMTWSLRGVTQGHDSIWRFSIISNFHSSLLLVTGHMATFLIGFAGGPTEAGLYKIGKDVATTLTKPAELLNQSIYPEFAKLGSQGSWAEFPRLILRGGALGGGAGVVLLAIALLFGQAFLTVAFGDEFVAAYAVLVLLVAAATLTVSGFSMDPALFAMGRPGIPLQVNAVSVFGIFLPLIYLLGKTYGATGAGLAALASSIFVFCVMAFFTTHQLRKRLANVPKT
ncbi:MAG: lipopolysaccharide biosynthesis protein [Rhodospirillaceae bacterium]|nr:lipopolysaccharide biosynthesis protein [Rhodospirillaceae bacterium]